MDGVGGEREREGSDVCVLVCPAQPPQALWVKDIIPASSATLSACIAWETDRDTERERQIERQRTERHAERDRDKDTETQRETDTETETQTKRALLPRDLACGGAFVCCVLFVVCVLLQVRPVEAHECE